MKPASETRPAITSLMWTSFASKPARSKAAAISTWPLTPCSRRIASRGRAPAGDEGRRHVLGGVEGEERARGRGRPRRGCGRTPARAHSGLSRSVCICQVVSDQSAVERRARLGEQHPAAAGDPHLVVGARARRGRGREAVPGEDAEDARPVVRARLQHDAQLLVEERGEEAAGSASGPARARGRRRRPVWPAKAISASVDEEAAVGAVVVGEHEARRAQLGERGEEPLSALGVVEVGRLVPRLAEDLRQDRPAEARSAAGQVDEDEVGVARGPCAAAASRSPRTSSQGAKAETTSDSGATTAFGCPSSCQVVRIDIESLPTGMPTPSRGHSSRATAFTVSKSAASSPGEPAAAIQLAESLTRESDSTGAAARLVRASATAMRPEAGASMTASGVRSPIAKASPA